MEVLHLLVYAKHQQGQVVYHAFALAMQTAVEAGRSTSYASYVGLPRAMRMPWWLDAILPLQVVTVVLEMLAWLRCVGSACGSFMNPVRFQRVFGL